MSVYKGINFTVLCLSFNLSHFRWVKCYRFRYSIQGTTCKDKIVLQAFFN